MANPCNLQRFVDAQADVFEAALAEIRSGSKQSHWMWFVFPQLAGLGRSPTAQYFAIASVGEARAYLAHPLLSDRLRLCCEALLPWSGKQSAEAIFGTVDAIKLRSSLTLFDAVEPKTSFAELLDSFFAGERDSATLALLPPAR